MVWFHFNHPLGEHVCTILVNADKLKSVPQTCLQGIPTQSSNLSCRDCWTQWRQKTSVQWLRTVKYFLDSAESCHMIQKSHAMTRSCQLSINSSWVLKAIKCIKIFGKPESWEHYSENWNYSAIAQSIILLLLSLPFWFSSLLLLLTPSPLHNCSK